MKEFLKDHGNLIISIVFGILDVVLRIFPNANLKFLVRPLFTANMLEVAIAIVVVWYAYKFIPSVYRRRLNYKRSERLLDNWKIFKEVLSQYFVHGEKSQEILKEYSRLRTEIEQDFNFFLNDIVKIQQSTHRNEQDYALRNFENCLKPHRIEDWYRTVQRQIPDELNCFDYILIGLVEHFKR